MGEETLVQSVSGRNEDYAFYDVKRCGGRCDFWPINNIQN